MATKTATIGFELASPLTFADGLEYDATLEIEVEVEIDYAERAHWWDVGDVTATDATVSVCGVDVPATAKASELLRQWLARPENFRKLSTMISDNLPDDPSYCPDPEYQRAVAHGRLILPNGRDVS